MRKSEKDKMLTGELYRASDPELVHERQRCRSVLPSLRPKRHSRESPGAARGS